VIGFWRHTSVEAFLETNDLKKKDIDPIPVDLFREYGSWFADCMDLRISHPWLEKFAVVQDSEIAASQAACPGISILIPTAPVFRALQTEVETPLSNLAACSSIF
jgi:hypothetical protein